MRLRPLQQRDVLQQERRAGERPIGEAARDLGARVCVVADGDGVDLRVHRLEARDRRLQQLGWRRLFVAHEFGEAEAS